MTQFLVPAYFYPSAGGSDWTLLTNAASSGVMVTAIMNPNSGPVDERNGDYVNAVTSLRSAGGRVIGYLPSSYSGRQFAGGAPTCPTTAGRYTPQTLIDCARRYENRYPGMIDGIFVDEMGQPRDGSVGLLDSIEFYRQLYVGLKTINPSWRIFGNPGAAIDEGYLRVGDRGGADVLVTFENTAALYQAWMPPSYQFRYPATSFGMIIYDASPSSFSADLLSSRQRNTSYIYVLDRFRSYRFDQLPSNWTAQVTAVKNANR